MTTTTMSEQDLLDQIQKLAGAINRHKDSSNRPEQTLRGRGGPPSRRPYQRTDTHSSSLTSASRGTHPYSRGRSSTPISRHRTLIVNPRPDDSSDSTATSSSTPAQWVQKRDRHMQLINASVYEERAQARANEILETKKQRLAERATRRDKSERQKLYAYLKRKGQGNQVSVLGNLFKVVAEGNKLEKFQGSNTFEWGGDVDNSVTTPKRIKVAGVAFHRSKNGNYWRKGAVAASRTKSSYPVHQNLIGLRSGTTKDKLCRYFTKTGITKGPGWEDLTVGSCAKGQSCRYIHDPDKLALCPAYLKDNCPLTADQCPLSHTPDAHRSPTCLHFNRGHCDKGADCRYAHIKTNPSAPVCRDFALLGYCSLGDKCEQRHVFECPDFTGTGECPRGGRCKLPHIDTATTVRKRTERENVRKRYHDDVDEEVGSEEEMDDDEEEEDEEAETESDVESEGVVEDDNGQRFEDQLDFMHL